MSANVNHDLSTDYGSHRLMAPRSVFTFGPSSKAWRPCSQHQPYLTRWARLVPEKLSKVACSDLTLASCSHFGFNLAFVSTAFEYIAPFRATKNGVSPEPFFSFTTVARLRFLLWWHRTWHDTNSWFFLLFDKSFGPAALCFASHSFWSIFFVRSLYTLALGRRGRITQLQTGFWQTFSSSSGIHIVRFCVFSSSMEWGFRISSSWGVYYQEFRHGRLVRSIWDSRILGKLVDTAENWLLLLFSLSLFWCLCWMGLISLFLCMDGLHWAFLSPPFLPPSF